MKKLNRRDFLRFAGGSALQPVRIVRLRSGLLTWPRGPVWMSNSAADGGGA